VPLDLTAKLESTECQVGQEPQEGRVQPGVEVTTVPQALRVSQETPEARAPLGRQGRPVNRATEVYPDQQDLTDHRG